jgi:hypothetical protein
MNILDNVVDTAKSGVTKIADSSALLASVALDSLSPAAGSLELLNAALNESSHPADLLRADGNTWVTRDHKVEIHKVDKLAADACMDFAWNIFDTQMTGRPVNGACRATEEAAPVKETETNRDNEPLHIDFTNIDNIYRTQRSEKFKANESPSGQDSLEYVNNKGDHVQVAVYKNFISYQETSDGKSVTSATQTSEQSTLKHGDTVYSLDIKGHRLKVTGEQVFIIQQNGNASVQLASGEFIKRESDRVILEDKDHHVIEGMDGKSLKFDGVLLFNSTAEMNRAAQSIVPEAHTVMLSAKDGAARALIPDGSQVELRADSSAIITNAKGQIFIVDHQHKVWAYNGSKYVPISQFHPDADTSVDEDGTLRTGQVNVNTNGVIGFAEGMLDLDRRMMQMNNEITGLTRLFITKDGKTYKESDSNQPAGKSSTGDSLPDGVRIEGRDGVVSARKGEDDVTTQLPGGKTFVSKIAVQQIENDDVSVGLDQIRIIDKIHGDTIIDADNDVHTDGGLGPSLLSDGSMQLDERTVISAEGIVTSGDWQVSSRSFASNGTFFDSTDRYLLMPTILSAQVQMLVASAQSTSASAETSSCAIYQKALSGVVTMADINKLSSEIGDITVLIASLKQAGAEDQIGALQDVLGLIGQTIAFASPKVQAAERAVQRGELSAFELKRAEGSTAGSTPNIHAMAIFDRH